MQSAYQSPRRENSQEENVDLSDNDDDTFYTAKSSRNANELEDGLASSRDRSWNTSERLGARRNEHFVDDSSVASENTEADMRSQNKKGGGVLSSAITWLSVLALLLVAIFFVFFAPAYSDYPDTPRFFAASVNENDVESEVPSNLHNNITKEIVDQMCNLTVDRIRTECIYLCEAAACCFDSEGECHENITIDYCDLFESCTIVFGRNQTTLDAVQREQVYENLVTANPTSNRENVSGVGEMQSSITVDIAIVDEIPSNITVDATMNTTTSDTAVIEETTANMAIRNASIDENGLDEAMGMNQSTSEISNKEDEAGIEHNNLLQGKEVHVGTAPHEEEAFFIDDIETLPGDDEENDVFVDEIEIETTPEEDKEKEVFVDEIEIETTPEDDEEKDVFVDEIEIQTTPENDEEKDVFVDETEIIPEIDEQTDVFVDEIENTLDDVEDGFVDEIESINLVKENDGAKNKGGGGGNKGWKNTAVNEGDHDLVEVVVDPTEDVGDALIFVNTNNNVDVKYVVEVDVSYKDRKRIRDACLNHDNSDSKALLCEQLCEPGWCCFQNGPSSCRDDEKCNIYAPCRLFNACKQETYEEDQSRCIGLCSEANCCYATDPGRSCFETNTNIVCGDYRPCDIIYYDT